MLTERKYRRGVMRRLRVGVSASVRFGPLEGTQSNSERPAPSLGAGQLPGSREPGSVAPSGAGWRPSPRSASSAGDGSRRGGSGDSGSRSSVLPRGSPGTNRRSGSRNPKGRSASRSEGDSTCAGAAGSGAGRSTGAVSGGAASPAGGPGASAGAAGTVGSRGAAGSAGAAAWVRLDSAAAFGPLEPALRVRRGLAALELRGFDAFDRDPEGFLDPDAAAFRFGEGAGRERRGRAADDSLGAAAGWSSPAPPRPTSLPAAVTRSMVLRAASAPRRTGRVISEVKFMRAF